MSAPGSVGERTAPTRRRSASLGTRMLLASSAVAVLVAGAFAVLVVAISTLRDATRAEAESKDVTAAALALERTLLVSDSTLSGYLLTRNRRLLAQWRAARAETEARLTTLQRLVRDPEQARRARNLALLIRFYFIDFVVPQTKLATTQPALVRDPEAADEGRRHVAGIRGEFARFLRAESELAASRAEAADEQSNRAIGLAVLGLLASASLIALAGVYLSRSIARPVREVASAATRLAGGELSLRIPQEAPGEVGELTAAFNSMAERLEAGRRELEAQNARLRESEQLKSELVSIVSHEVRTPLASVLGFTSLLLQREHSTELRRRYLEIIDQQARRLAALLDDFLDVQRVEEGRLELNDEEVDVAALLREQTQLFTAQSQRHRLELRVDEAPLAVRGDADRLAQVVGNLLSNAIKYSPAGGVVEVVGVRDNGRVRVTVRDEGLGIADDAQQRIFTKFFRGDAAATGINGSGLGLAFSRAVVEAHGGHISFTSAVGQGSTFHVDLPAAR